MQVFPGISNIRFGKPCIAGTRIDVATVLAGLASGATADELTAQYSLTREQNIRRSSLRSTRGGSFATGRRQPE
jgi:hypothetical protein